jgi:glucosylceramidase
MKQYESSLATGFIQLQPTLNGSQSPYTIKINSDKRFQSIIGFGGAFTEAAAYNFSKLSKDQQSKITSLYFDPKDGLRYSMGRIAMNSCDFALGNYSYVDEYDTSLSSFDISREKEWVIPMIHQAQVVAQQPISICASPWSPPAWMKTNNQMNHGGQLKEEYYPLWASYFARFIHEMRREEIHITAVTPQNEPAAVQVWDSCIYSAEEEGRFVLDHLGPTLHKEGLADIDIYIWDHNRDVIVERVRPILQDPRARQYVHGVALHWYVSEEFENLSKVKELFPETHLLFTEGCIEGGTKLGAFSSGERYMRNLIGDFSNGLEGYIDWNLLLDLQGGPNHVGNYCDAPILCDPDNDIVHINSSYYAIGHFSKFVDVGATRIDSSSNHPFVNHVTFLNPAGEIVSVLQNETDQATTVRISDSVIQLQPHSFSTIIMEASDV